MAEKSFRPWSPRQSFLLPPSPSEWLPKGHLAYFILEVVEELDLSAIEEKVREKDPRGERPYAVGMMTGLLLYGYCVGEYSSRRIARGTYEVVAFGLIAGGQHPHFTTINQFRLEHGQALSRLFVEVLQLCRRSGLVKMGQVALDGTKIKAAASKHKAMSYKRMNDEEQRLRAEVEQMMRRAEAVDREEDELYGVGQEEQDLPEELQRREQRLARIRAAKAELEKEAAEGRGEQLRQQAERQRARIEDELLPTHERKRSATRAKKAEQQAEALGGEGGKKDRGGQGSSQPELPLHRVACELSGAPKPSAQRNFTDPDSRIMLKDGAYIQAYNAQIIVDAAHQVIVAHAVSNQPPDVQYLVPLVRRMQGNGVGLPTALLADSGYLSAENLSSLHSRGIDPYIATGREAGGAAVSGGARTAASDAMRTKLGTPAGKAVYSRRKVIVEPVFGQIQQARGFRRFSQRGRAKVNCEWGLVCMAHNLLKLFRHRPTAGPLPMGFVAGSA
jgi:transposase